MHFNDNFRLADDDLGVGGVHFVEYLEALFWLHEVEYQGWVSLDVHSPRENSREIITASAEYLQKLSQFLKRVGVEKMRTLVNSGDGSQLIRLFNAELFGSL